MIPKTYFISGGPAVLDLFGYNPDLSKVFLKVLSPSNRIQLEMNSPPNKNLPVLLVGQHWSNLFSIHPKSNFQRQLGKELDSFLQNKLTINSGFGDRLIRRISNIRLAKIFIQSILP